MNFWWIPTDCKHPFDDTILLRWRVRWLVSECRRHPSFKDNSRQRRELCRTGWGGSLETEGYCEECTGVAHLAVHHVRPLWSYALEYYCDGMQGKAEGHALEFLHSENRPRPEFEEWNKLENLLAVCKSCHNRLETKVYSWWKQELVSRYRPQLCYSYSEAKRSFEKYYAIKEPHGRSPTIHR